MSIPSSAMNISNDFFSLLQTVTIDCKDNGEHFIVDDRIKVIEQLLAGTPYKLVCREPLALVFAKHDLCEGESVVLISSHIDCLYDNCFCNDAGDCLRGTFDNSLGNTAVLWCMLNDMLPDNVVVTFTGDEERDSQGAVQTLLAIGRAGCGISLAIVQDVTNTGWESEALFAIENDSGIDLLTAHSIVSLLNGYKGQYAFEHNAEPDESWDYADYGIPCFSLCLPVCGNLHGDAGVLVRKSSVIEYCKVLSMLANRIL